MSRAIKASIAAGIVSTAFVVYLYFFGWTTAMAGMAQWIGHKYPYVWNVPVALPDTSVGSGTAKTQVALGYQFEVPWDDLDETQTKIGERAGRLKGRSSRWTLGFMIGKPNELVNAMTTNKNSRAIYGKDLQSDAALRKAIYATTPSQVKPWSPRIAVARDLSYLVMKGAMMLPAAETGMYEISSGTMKGFQFGNPKLSKKVELELSDDLGGFSFFLTQEREGQITQAEINRIVQSVKRVPTPVGTMGQH